jgi:hypothetical protein
MQPEELTEEQKWLEFNVAMAREEKYLEIRAKRRRRRESTRELIKYVVVLWLLFAVWACLEVKSTFGRISNSFAALSKLKL